MTNHDWKVYIKYIYIRQAHRNLRQTIHVKNSRQTTSKSVRLRQLICFCLFHAQKIQHKFSLYQNKEISCCRRLFKYIYIYVLLSKFGVWRSFRYESNRNRLFYKTGCLGFSKFWILKRLSPLNWDDTKKSGKIMKHSCKKSGKKYAKMRDIRDIGIRKINKIKLCQFF